MVTGAPLRTTKPSAGAMTRRTDGIAMCSNRYSPPAWSPNWGHCPKSRTCNQHRSSGGMFAVATACWSSVNATLPSTNADHVMENGSHWTSSVTKTATGTVSRTPSKYIRTFPPSPTLCIPSFSQPALLDSNRITKGFGSESEWSSGFEFWRISSALSTPSPSVSPPGAREPAPSNSSSQNAGNPLVVMETFVGFIPWRTRYESLPGQLLATVPSGIHGQIAPAVDHALGSVP